MNTRMFHLALCLIFSISAGYAQTALDFNPGAGDQHLEIPDITCPQEFTFEAWVYFRGHAETYITILEFGDDSPWFGLIYDNEDLTYHLTLYDNVYDSMNFPINSWTHIAATFSVSDSIGRLYVNGELHATDSLTDIVLDGAGAGIAYYSSDDAFSGSIDDLRIWSARRSQNEISSNMHSCLTGSETNLYAFYNFDEGSGSTAHDLSSNGFDGKLVDMDTMNAWISTSLCWTNDVPGFSPVNAVLNIYPNPANSSFAISGLSEATNYGIYSLDGKMVQSASVYPGIQIDIADLDPGYYFIILENQGVLRFLKE